MALHVMEEANRCLGCKAPQCQKGCPIATPIPEVIRLLAYAHRYLFPVLAVLLPVLLARSKTQALLGMGIGLTFYGVYTLLGYLLRWKHIYCSWQDISHQKMTPAHIQWKNVRKADVYGLSAVCIGFGLLVVVVSVFVL